MPRRRRILVEDGFYHVYNRFARGESVFDLEGAAERFVDLVRVVKKRDGVQVLAWALMSNHYHVALRTQTVPLSRSMHFLQGRFSKGFNRRWGRSGPVWQSRYQAKLVSEESYLMTVICYVHMNPVRGGLVDDPAEHRSSGHRELMGRVRNPLIDVDASLAIFGDTKRRAKRGYRTLMQREMEREHRSLAPERLPWWLERDRSVVPPEGPLDEGRADPGARDFLTAEELVERSCEVLGVEMEDLVGRGRSPEVVRARRLIALLGIERWGQTAKDLGRVLSKHPDSISRMAGQMATRRAADPDSGIEREVNALDRALAYGADKGQNR